MHVISGLLDGDAVAHIRAILAAADWIDGAATAGHLSRRAKRNRQLPEGSAAAQEAGAIVLAALEWHPGFVSAALPARIVPPLFNRYGPGETYGPHIDGAIRPVPDGRVRTDLSATVFLSAPEEYEGGFLRIAEPGGDRRIKLGAGDMILYPASTVHEVEPVTKGERLASFFWIQSIVRDPTQRTMLHELDQAIQAIDGLLPDHQALVALTGHYHNLVRLWADV